MGRKKFCSKCRLTLNRNDNMFDKNERHPCPNCGKKMLLLPHRFRPPKKSDESKWKAVLYLLNQGFRFEKKYTTVPQNLRDAKELGQKEKERENYLKKLAEKERMEKLKS